MKSVEKRKADREARAIATFTAPRTGYTPDTTEEPSEPSPAVQGLKLSNVQLWPLERFKPHPANHVFEQSKTEKYWRGLRRDILEAGAIINPVIALQDGTLLEGHSRIRIARELAAGGHDLGRIPVLVVASPITPEEVERRVYLGNLSRFEIDEDTRLDLYAKVWPDFYGKGGKAGRPGKSDNGYPITAREIARQVGKSEHQVKKDRAIVVKAKRIAAGKGKLDADAEDIRDARNKAAAQRRVKTKATAKKAAALLSAPGRVTLQLTRGHAEIVLRILRRVKLPNAPAAVIHDLEIALKGKR